MAQRGLELAKHPPPWLLDGAFLTAITIASALLYVRGLGFHGDDWGYFAELRDGPSRSLKGLAENIYAADPAYPQRPVWLTYVATMHWLFGLQPLGYHIVGIAILAAIALLLYGVLRELDQPRVLCALVPLLYVLLPNYSGARLWFAGQAALLGVLLLVVSTYAALRALRSSRLFVVWLAAGAAAVVASGMTYEVALPLFAAGVFALALRPWTVGPADARSVAGRRRRMTLVAGYGAALLFVLVFKASVTDRVGIDQPYLDYLARVVRGSLQANFGAYGAGAPYVVSWIAAHAPSVKVFALAALVGAVAGLYIGRLAPTRRRDLRGPFRKYVVAGLLIFAIGYVIFVVPTLVAFESVGRENRTATAATIGVAILYGGLAAGVASFFARPAARRAAFGVAAGIVCAAAFVVTNTQARFWVDAYETQQEIENRIATDVGPLPRGAALVLDGVCLQRRGAWVLTGARDLPGLLRLRQGRVGIQGAAISRPVRVDSRGIHVKAFTSVASFPYGNDLFVYNFHRRATYRLRSQADARAYFKSRTFRPERDCPRVFAWGVGGG